MTDFFCALCGRPRLASRCGCQGTVADTITLPLAIRIDSEAAHFLRLAQLHRDAAKLYPEHAPANIEDAERLERLALQGKDAR